MKEPLILPKASRLAPAIARKEPISLYPSATQVIPKVLAAALVLAVVGLLRGWWITLGGAGLAIVLLSIPSSRRVDIDRSGICFVPLLPIRPRQRLRFDSLGPFRVTRGRTESVVAVLDPSVRYRLGGMFRRGEVQISTMYGPSVGQPPVTAAELRELLQTYRTAEADPPNPFEADRRFRRKERWVIWTATVVGIVIVAVIVSAAH